MGQSRASATSNANSKVLRVGMVVEDRARDSIDQMNAIAAVVDEWRAGVSPVYTRGAQVDLLTQALATLPPDHRDRPGLIRAIEVLRHDARGRTTRASSSCHCDGPPHAYSPGWCPDEGPVVQ